MPSPPEHGIREVPILARRKKPVGYVAYCTPCDWSTKILIGTTEHGGWNRADILLANHLKSARHKK